MLLVGRKLIVDWESVYNPPTQFLYSLSQTKSGDGQSSGPVERDQTRTSSGHFSGEEDEEEEAQVKHHVKGRSGSTSSDSGPASDDETVRTGGVATVKGMGSMAGATHTIANGHGRHPPSQDDERSTSQTTITANGDSGSGPKKQRPAPPPRPPRPTALKTTSHGQAGTGGGIGLFGVNLTSGGKGAAAVSQQLENAAVSKKLKAIMKDPQLQMLNDRKQALLNSVKSEVTDLASSARTDAKQAYNALSSTVGEVLAESHREKPFQPLAPRVSTADKISPVRQHLVVDKITKKQMDLQSKRLAQDQAQTQVSNQQFLNEVVENVQSGSSVGWMKASKVKRLLQDESYRNFIISRLHFGYNRSGAASTSSNSAAAAASRQYIPDVKINKATFNALLSVLKVLVTGLENTYRSLNTSAARGGGMASAFMLLEIAHTHYYSTDQYHQTPPKVTPAPSHPSPSSSSSQSFSSSSYSPGVSGSGGTVSSESGGGSSDVSTATSTPRNSSVSVSSSSATSQDDDPSHSEVPSSASSSGTPAYLRGSSLGGGGGDYEEVLTRKCRSSGTFRFRTGGRLIQLSSFAQPIRNYLFEALNKDRSTLWDHMQFWEDAFLDAVSQERDIIGMDQGPADMIDRYRNLSATERRRLELDEDRLLVAMLTNLVSFMVMMNVSKGEVGRKVRRLIGRAHISLDQSQELSQLLENLNELHSNDIDLRPSGSRLLQKFSFTVHWGSDNTGQMLFLEVCDDGLILRSVTSQIIDRWWYEALVNVMYCPRTKVLSLWRRLKEKTELNQFYTKKCKQLYFCIVRNIEKVATRNNNSLPSFDSNLSSKFAIDDPSSGQSGVVTVCERGVEIALNNTQRFIELCHIKKCFSRKNEILVIEHFDPNKREVNKVQLSSPVAAYLIVRAICRSIAMQHPSPVVVNEAELIRTEEESQVIYNTRLPS